MARQYHRVSITMRYVAIRSTKSIDLSSWIALPDAARTLECSEKTVNRYISKGLIERQYRRVPGRRKLPVLSPIDIEKIRKETVERAPFVVAGREEKALARVAPSLPPEANPFRRLQELLERQPSVSPEHKLFLNLEEAADYTGLSKSYLSELARTGELPAIKRAGWRFWREGLHEHLSRLLLPKHS
jgi:excisionase family DNA binding protein